MSLKLLPMIAAALFLAGCGGRLVQGDPALPNKAGFAYAAVGLQLSGGP